MALLWASQYSRWGHRLGGRPRRPAGGAGCAVQHGQKCRRSDCVPIGGCYLVLSPGALTLTNIDSEIIGRRNSLPF